MNTPLPPLPGHSRAFTLMEILVISAIAIALVAIAVPTISAFRQRAHKQVALEKMRTLGGTIANYASQNGGVLPEEDADNNDSWSNISKPAAKDAWYNALPRLLGRKGAGDYASNPPAFYTNDSALFLPGANYPDKKKLLEPLFAIAFNTKLQRTSPTGEKLRTRVDEITNAAKTVVLLEQGLLNESRTLEIQTKKDYDGSPKGSAKSFVGRYNGHGHLCFIDGHVELVKASELLTETGAFPFPQNAVVWTRTPEENPNKDGLTMSAQKKSKK